MTVDRTPITDRVIVAVFDGLRPDMVTSEFTPNILRLADRGTWFRQARSVFPSVTRVATTSIATGAPPTTHGIVGNAFYHPAVMPERVMQTSHADHLRRAEVHHNGRFVDVDTLGDVLARAGKRLAVVHTGSAGSAHLVNPRAKINGHWTFSMHGPDGTQTPAAFEDALKHIGPLPGRELPRLGSCDMPAASWLNMCCRHSRRMLRSSGSMNPIPPTTIRVLVRQRRLQVCKKRMGLLERILDWVDAQPDADRIVVIVVSDHGQISTSLIHPIFDGASKAGFDIGTRDELDGAAFVATGGLSGEVRLLNDDRPKLDRLAAWLIDQPEVGHLFSPGRNEIEGQIEGTLSLGLIGNGHDRQPDLMFILRSDLTPDQFGLPGLGIMTPGDVPLGGGMHGGINPHELNTVLIVGTETSEGRGKQSATPAGIIDVTPTVLGLLGLPQSATMHGRNLINAPREEARVTRHSYGNGTFTQHVDIVEQQGRSFILGGGQ